MYLLNREKKILEYLISNSQTTLSQIAKYMNLSNKTVAHSLTKLDVFLRDKNVRIVRKSKIGVVLEGEPNQLNKIIEENRQEGGLETKSERVKFLCIEILRTNHYFTIQDLMEKVYVSKTTLEKDLQEVYEIFKKFNVEITRVPGKGSILNLNELEKRELAIDLIHYFWAENWSVIKNENDILYSLGGIPSAFEFFDHDVLIKVNRILQKYIKKKEIQISDYSYRNILLKIVVSIQRIQCNQMLDEKLYRSSGNNALLLSIQLLQIMLEEAFYIGIPETEILYIAESLLAEQTFSYENNYENDIQELESILLQSLPNYDEKLVKELALHIFTSVNRIKKNLGIDNPFVEDLKKKFPVSFEQSLSLTAAVQNFFQLEIPEEEVAFWAVHIQAYKERNNLGRKINVLLICNNGTGTSQLMAARIRKNFPQLNIRRIISIQDLANMNTIVEDLILSTVPLKIDLPTKVLVVSPLLDEFDQKMISQKIQVINNVVFSSNRKNDFSRLIDPKNVLLDIDLKNIEEVIEYIGNHLIKNCYANEGIIDSAKKREKISFTSFNQFATPHADSKYILESTITFLRLNKPISWGEHRVKFVFFFGIKNPNAKKLESIFDTLLKIIDEEKASSILNKGNKENIIEYLKGEL